MTLKDRVSLRYKIMTRVTEHMYRSVMEQHNEFIANLVVANNLKRDEYADSFYWEGEKYPKNLGYYRNTVALDVSLHAEMLAHLAWFTPIMRDEYPLVESFVRKVLNYSDDIAFNIGLFPDALHSVVASIVDTSDLPRTSKKIDEVAKILNLSDKYVKAVSFRLMADLVGA